MTKSAAPASTFTAGIDGREMEWGTGGVGNGMGVGLGLGLGLGLGWRGVFGSPLRM
jgi:hypothetical protein